MPLSRSQPKSRGQLSQRSKPCLSSSSRSILAARSAGHLPWWPGIGAIFATWDRQECAYPPLTVDLAESLGCRIAHAMAHTYQPGRVSVLVVSAKLLLESAKARSFRPHPRGHAKGKAPPVGAGPRYSGDNACLRADAGRDHVVPGVQGRAERGQTSDRHDGDEGSDQALLDRGRARAVLQNLANEFEHYLALLRPRMSGAFSTSGLQSARAIRELSNHPRAPAVADRRVGRLLEAVLPG